MTWRTTVEDVSICVVSVTQEKPIQALIYQVKKTEKGDNNFKKKLAWALRELKILDAKDASKVNMTPRKYQVVYK